MIMATKLDTFNFWICFQIQGLQVANLGKAPLYILLNSMIKNTARPNYISNYPKKLNPLTHDVQKWSNNTLKALNVCLTILGHYALKGQHFKPIDMNVFPYIILFYLKLEILKKYYRTAIKIESYRTC